MAAAGVAAVVLVVARGEAAVDLVAVAVARGCPAAMAALAQAVPTAALVEVIARLAQPSIAALR